MIANDRQLFYAKSKAERVRAALVGLKSGDHGVADLDPRLKSVQNASMKAELALLDSQILEFERLRDGEVRSFETNSLADLPRLLIQARIAAKLTQKQLAERLGLKEPQIFIYEATAYRSASFGRMVKVADAIGLKLSTRLKLIEPGDPQAVLKRLFAIGLDEGFLKRRIMRPEDIDRDSVDLIADRVGAIFAWSPREILGSEVLKPVQLGGVKIPTHRASRSAAIYTAYTNYLATLCAKAVADRPRGTIPSEWSAFRNILVHDHGGVDFRACLELAWDLGVVVLPLNEPAAFLSASGRINPIKVVVLNQAQRFPSRWLFDLIYELRRAADNPEAPEFEGVQSKDASNRYQALRDERACRQFAGQVMLDGEAERLSAAVIAQAGDDRRRLKSSVTAVAAQAGADISALANFVAHQLAQQNVNWWRHAAKLQDTTYDPLALAKDVFYQRFDFDRLDEAERDLLTLALNDEPADA